jgi:alpha-glutamyl/putrescinyl thymine pyrophosphorylase clade 1
MSAEELIDWISERGAIHTKKEAGHPPPWTDDPILREWSFCNVRREDDRVTRWIAGHWRAPREDDRDLWFAMVVARFVNWPPTLAEIGFPVPWQPDRFITVLTNRAARRELCFGPAYVISNGSHKGAKSLYLAEHVFTPLWHSRERLRPRSGQTLAAWHGSLTRYNGLGSFMAAQVVADMKYVPPLCDAPDWHTWAASGPGSRRGLNRVLGRPVDVRWNEFEWLQEMRRLHQRIAPELARRGVELHAQDLQNCLCEFDKYRRVKCGEGTPKRRYRPTAL